MNNFCYKNCISEKYLLDEKLIKQSKEILSKNRKKTKRGRPEINWEAGLNGIYYLLKTGIPWKALPGCFGSSSAVHRLFQKLRDASFFEELWHRELEIYDQKIGLELAIQAADCSHVKAPLGCEKTGKSPVDRRKLGTKRSIITDENGIFIGCAIGRANQHDSKLFWETIQSVPNFINQPYYKQMHLDAAYDSEEIRTILFNTYYIPKIAKNKRRKKDLPKEKIFPLGYQRWFVERSHSWLNKFRRLFVKYEKTATNYLALLHFSFSIIIFRKIRI